MLSDAARAQVARWGLDANTVDAAGLFEVPAAGGVYPGMPHLPAIVIPYWRPDRTVQTYVNGTGKPHPFARLRLLAAPHDGGWRRKTLRYLQPAHSGVHVYLPPLVDWQAVAADPSIPLIITEGEAKALAACRAGFTCLALGGVYSFTTPGGRLLPDLEALVHPSRAVYIVFDSDAATNPNVVAAEARLVQALQTDRGMRCTIVRLPARGEAKVGLDDYLRDESADAFERLLRGSPAMSPLDARIVGMNKRYAWIDHENQVYNIESRLFVRKESFVSGSLASSETFPIPYKNGMKHVPLAPKWLTHTHALRYAEALFRPSAPEVLEGEHGPALNMWRGWENHEAGDIKPWMRVNEFLFRDVPAQWQDLALKLMAYKAQHPERKVPLCPVLIGDQGTGKGVWADSLIDAFSPYSIVLKPSSLGAEFQGWLETTLLAATHEITPEEIGRQGDTLKALISDSRRIMNVKFRPAREVISTTLYIITSNHRGVGSYAADDRRMFVVDTPPVGAQEMYTDAYRWKLAGGGRRLMHYLLHYPLGGWEPPPRAPMTAGKQLATAESMTIIQQLAVDMRRGNMNYILHCWDMALQWAAANESSNDTKSVGHARAIVAAARSFPIRPWYTPEELAMLLPFALETSGRGSMVRTPAGTISRQLRDAGIRYLVNRDNPEGFAWMGRTRQYLVVAEVDDWQRPISQADFERAMGSWPTYSELRGLRK